MIPEDKHILLWLLFLMVFGLCAGWLWHENRQLSVQLKKLVDPHVAHWFRRLAWSRSWQFLAVLGCSMIIIIIYDWQLSDARQQLRAEQEKAQKAALMPDMSQDISAMVSVFASQVHTAPKPPAPVQSPIEELYDPEATATDNQSVMDELKKRYEEIIVTYLFLEKCGKTSPNDYRVIMSALGQEMASVNAPGRLQYDILTAARGSYKEMYAASSCKDADTATLYKQYTDYIKTLSEHFPAQ